MQDMRNCILNDDNLKWLFHMSNFCAILVRLLQLPQLGPTKRQLQVLYRGMWHAVCESAEWSQDSWAAGVCTATGHV